MVDVNIAEELFEIKAKMDNIGELLNNITNELKILKQYGGPSSAIPPPPPMQGLIQPKKPQAVKTPQFNGVMNELNELFK